MIRTVSELMSFQTFEERYRYLRIGAEVGQDTFGFDRYLNQALYKSKEWKNIRDYVIIRDNGCDLAIPDRLIGGKILIHHINPISKTDINTRSQFLLDPEYLICVCKNTHDAIHFGDEDLLIKIPEERTVNDTCPWKHNGGNS